LLLFKCEPTDIQYGARQVGSRPMSLPKLHGGVGTGTVPAGTVPGTVAGVVLPWARRAWLCK
jgi:hypothetical protein